MADTLARPAVLAVRGIRMDYRTAIGVVAAVRELSIEVPDTGLTVLAGPSGSGKSTLLRVLGLIERPSAGIVEFNGTVVSSASNARLRQLRRTKVALVFQNPGENLLAELSVSDNLLAAAQAAGQPDRGPELLARFGLEHTARWRINALSGGQQQRLAFGCALARGARVILADEPTSQLDATSADLVLATLAELRAEGLAIIVASHDPRVVAMGDTIGRLRDGELTELTHREAA